MYKTILFVYRFYVLEFKSNFFSSVTKSVPQSCPALPWHSRALNGSRCNTEAGVLVAITGHDPPPPEGGAFYDWWGSPPFQEKRERAHLYGGFSSTNPREVTQMQTILGPISLVLTLPSRPDRSIGRAKRRSCGQERTRDNLSQETNSALQCIAIWSFLCFSCQMLILLFKIAYICRTDITIQLRDGQSDNSVALNRMEEKLAFDFDSIFQL
ncbi:hypothetical protein AVEN_9618-1 [Araneus ventricosus]|uniref:Uncharacterized protein n=1 Tax=Araneus ventricosus TaxID=182803 RepID=A0A4Y2EV32_ARAVE|nr:hypothetical protein AVEN_9618-1 [Araneus ventricosus]